MPPGLDKPADLSRFWIDKLLQKQKPIEFIDAMTNFISNNGKEQSITSDKLNTRLSGLIALLTMTPDFQLI